MWQIAVVLGVLFGMASCSGSNGHGGGQKAAPEYAITQTGGSVVQTSVDGSRVFGPGIMLERDEKGMHGSGPLGVVDLRKEGDSLRGFIGQLPTELHLEHDDEGGFRMRGMFGGTLGSIEVTSERVQGQLGRCQYNLRRYDQEENGVIAYTGRRFCGRNIIEPTTVKFAPTIFYLPPLERAAIISILLGR
jgi:hypothetical protein